MNIEDARVELDSISKEIISLEKYQEKIEAEDNYDPSIYDKIDELEARRYELDQLISREEA